MIKPIETEYCGIRFRSRLEARYAILFDELGLKWEYEKEGFDIHGKKYLPDFWFPEQKWWIEIKGGKPTREEECLLYEVAEHTHAKAAYIFFGQMHMPGEVTSWDGDSSGYMIYPLWDSYHIFCQCPVCHKIGIEFCGRGARVCGDKCMPDDDTNLLIKSYREAIGARFEYDERK
jgi:hypothetical protein